MSISQRRSVRIISGSKRGSKIYFTAIPGLRPSGDRIRETLFAWLQSSLAGIDCLDMFAGSGALSFEAVSRGADRVVSLENNRQAVSMLRENAERLRVEGLDIILADALSASVYRNQLSQRQFDLIFIDPPFADNLHQAAIDVVQENRLLNPAGFVYLEAAKGQIEFQLPDDWQLYREKVAGEVQLQLYRAAGDPEVQ